MPAGPTAQDAAPLICAGVTSYKRIKETAAKPGQWIVVSGLGGLGHLAVQYAKAMGLHVCAVDIDDGKLAHATRLGADAVVKLPTPLFDVVANCITIRGSFVGTRRDMAEALAFAAEGKVKADSELQPLSAITNVFERLAHGDVPSRVVLDFAGH